MTKSQAFTQYNQTRTDATLDPARVNRALGIAQAKQPRPYVTTANSCTCPDRTYRKVVCKHMIAARMEMAAASQESN
jgi:hypothetical protein